MGIDGSEIKRRKEMAEKEANKAIATASYRPPAGGVQIDCHACKQEGGMQPENIARFGPILRFIGVLIVVPSLFGAVLAVIMFISSGNATSEVMSTTTSSAGLAGAAIGGALGFGISIFMFCSSIVGGAIGWLLLMRKKVYKCCRCGYILDRA